MCCLPVACCISLLFPLRFYYFLTRIGQFPPTTGRLTCLWHRCSRCELCHYSSDFSRQSFFTRKVQDFGVPKLIFDPSRFRGRVLIAKTLGTRLPLVSARGPKNLLLHGKNQACRAPYYWPACQNLGVPYPK